MVVNNQERIKFLKRLFFLVCLLLAIIALVFILLEYYLPAILCGIAFAIWYLIFRVVDFQYIEYNDEEGKITLRYYPVIKLGAKEYSSIEFSQKLLYDASFGKSLAGMVSDLTLSVRTKRGIASYPSVSFAAVPRKEKKRIEGSLQQILGK